ncbi:MAG: ribbon-helix-helix protein, CopG family [Deltaproteobacteria bacterium]|nr:ribbon-helix-helix protein, CopG family [Deltaproteobacteria bacterium]
MNTQNITLKLEKDLLLKVKQKAAALNTSMSQLMRDSLKKFLLEESDYEKSKKRAIELMRKALPLGGGRPYKNRSELYDRNK